MNFQQPQGAYFVENYDGLFELVAFVKNRVVLQARMDQREDHTKKNFAQF